MEVTRALLHRVFPPRVVIDDRYPGCNCPYPVALIRWRLAQRAHLRRARSHPHPEVPRAGSRTAMARSVDDELVILDVTSGRYYSLNAVGAFVWDLLADPIASEAIVDAVIETYEIDRATAQSDVDELLAELSAAGLVSE